MRKPKLLKKSAFKLLAKHHDLVDFGAIESHETIDAPRGSTFVAGHHDQQVLSGNVAGYDVMVVRRRLADKELVVTKVDLSDQAWPHLLVASFDYPQDLMAQLFTLQPNLREVNFPGDATTGRTHFYCDHQYAHQIHQIIAPETLHSMRMLPAQTTLELQGGNLYVVSAQSPATIEGLEAQLNTVIQVAAKLEPN